MVAAVFNVKVDVAAQKQVQLVCFMPVIKSPHVISGSPVKVEKVFVDGIITKFKRLVHLVPPGQFAQ
ncbi:hypothetical protein D3C87_1885770 [compost metagenome]